jgi:peptidoglycan/xylan/chitin deacetylase (PgdA/CDA1 family)
MRAALHAALILRRARKRNGTVGAALVYHRVGSGSTLDASIEEREFLGQLDHLRDAYRVVPSSELAEAAAVRRAGDPFPVALTFDDDSASHARVAAPALRSRGLPAAFFLTGATLDRSVAPWWDDLERLGYAPGLEGHSVAEAARAIELLGKVDRAAAAQALRRLAPPGGEPGLPRGDVRLLAESGFEIGFHSRDHDPLPTLDDDEVEAAVTVGRAALAEAAGKPVDSFAYPHGLPDTRGVSALRAAGYARAFTGAARPVTGATEELLIPRYQAATSADGLRIHLARVFAAAVGAAAGA